MDNKKNVLITGCSSGIGYETTALLLEKGYRVFATARNESDLDMLRTLGAFAIYCDLADRESIQTCVKIVKSKIKCLDCLVNNAAYAQPSAVLDLGYDELKSQFDVNVFGTMELTRLVCPLLNFSVQPTSYFC